MLTVIQISSGGAAVAEAIKKEFPGAEIVSGTSFKDFLSENFHRREALVFIGALGICVRLISPYVEDKHTDPAVVCVDTTGHYVIPVLSGHIGGANELSLRLAMTLGAEAVVTTQSDRTGLWALDTLGEKFGWRTTSTVALNKIISLFVGKVPTLLCLEAEVYGTGWLERTAPPHVTVRRTLPEKLDEYSLIIFVSPFIHETGDVPALVYIPRILHVGIGLARQAGPIQSIIGAMSSRLASEKLNPLAIKCFSTIDLKSAEPVVRALQEDFPVAFFTAEQLRVIDVPTPSDVVNKHVGTRSVCEASAILSSDNGELIMPKRKGSDYTIAVAVEKGVLRGQGHVEIVGAGPGDPELISLRGRKLLERADLILYAGSLVPRELTLCAKPGATVRSSASMNLQEQLSLMKEYYDQGKLIVRLHTGDPCIYGAIDEQMNYFDQHGMSYHITPGISSFQAAASALRSQFTIPERVQTIILTRGEGRTPMPEREKLHLLARSRSTLCIFLSAGITDRVQDELLQEYPPTTPVAVCYHLTWPDERIFRGQLADLARLVNDNGLTLTTLLVVGDAIDNRQGLSRLYSAEFAHKYRNNEPRTANSE